MLGSDVTNPFSNASPLAWEAALTLTAATVLYLAYNLLTSPAAVARLFPGRDAAGVGDLPSERLRTTNAFYRKYLGVVLLGLVPAIVLAVTGRLDRAGLQLPHDVPMTLLLALGFVAITALPIVFESRKPSFRLSYPEVRAPLRGQLAAHNAFAWAIYLLAYEFFFRGVLVVFLAGAVGPLPALTMSTMAYVFAHFGRYPGEVIGTLVSGTAFGLIALATESILAPFLAHLAVALLSDTLASRRV